MNRADRLSVQNNPAKHQQMAILEDGPIGRDRRYGKRRSAGARVDRETLASGVIDARVGDVRLDAKRFQYLLSLHLILERQRRHAGRPDHVRQKRALVHQPIPEANAVVQDEAGRGHCERNEARNHHDRR